MRQRTVRAMSTGLLLGALVLPGLSGAMGQSFLFPGGTEVEFVAPILQPGQIILAKLVQAPEITRVSIRLLGKVYELGPNEQGLETFAPIGLDLDLKPGPYEVDMTVFLRDGRTEELRREIQIGGREFPIKKLWVKEQYVRPPADVQARIQREAEILELVYSASSASWLGEGLFERPHPGEMALNFAEKRIYNNVPRSTHAGIDIAAPLGSPVVASNSGRVVLARDLYFSGNTVIIDHGLGLFTFYCHFSSLKARRGELVKKGSVIGLAGSTGRSTGPHLHWAVRLQGCRVDPVALLGLDLPE